MDNPNTQNDSGSYQSMCSTSGTVNFPCSRTEQRSATTDNCGKFWLFGGWGPVGSCNDLWMYDPAPLEWQWISGSDTDNTGNYGIKGVPSLLNVPPSRGGALAWWGNDNKFYLFGGWGLSGVLSDLWVFDPDPSCVSLCDVIDKTSEPVTENKIYVFPNPATTQMIIRIPFEMNNQTATFSIINVLGETVSQEIINLNGDILYQPISIPAGIYFIQIASDKESWTGKFIKE
jgi:hypothetical protein